MKERYESYKDSGVAWIGQVPAGWEVRRLKTTGSFDNGLTYSPSDISDDGYVVLRSTNIQDSKIDYSDVVKVKVVPTKLIAQKGDIIVCSRNGSAALVGKCAIFDGKVDATFGAFMMRYRPQICVEYAFYIFQHAMKIYQGLFSTTTINQLTQNIISQIKIPRPPLPEQRSIAAYLDQRCAAIDAYVASLEREAALARELKQAVIARAVTRGLDPNTPMRDSGIPWIGQVPQGWEVRRAKFMFKKNKRPVRPEDEVITCFRDGQVTLRKNRRTEGFTESLTEFGYQGIRKGDLVIHQMDAFAGSIGVSDSDGKGTSVYHCCTPKGDYDTKYYAYLLRQMAYSGFIQSLYRGIRERSSDFSFNVFGNQYLVVPPLPVQHAIAVYLDARCAAIDAYVASLEREAALARELKQREIADAVTGKVRVAG